MSSYLNLHFNNKPMTVQAISISSPDEDGHHWLAISFRGGHDFTHEFTITVFSHNHVANALLAKAINEVNADILEPAYREWVGRKVDEAIPF